ncbi:MAG: DUF484 family protein [Dokdonella sp.]|uniref:DUF484 family protein n=1 Tax=Dokdonella sp. TaxID=2291710 RepID=UPI0025C2014A|nr:DUF484 family protein [Dokdonella sp.]MBX3700143.1 DUF484 family protein [Dokdonella sp.]
MSEFSVKDGLSAMDVAGYLRRHPDFLSAFPDIALALQLPREQGKAASLASYQLDVLRDKNRELGRRLHELVEIAHENEALMVRVHTLTLALMRARSLPETATAVVAALAEDFRDPPAYTGAAPGASLFVRLVLFRADPDLPAADWLIAEPAGSVAFPAFDEFFKRGEPLCGRLQQDKLDALFGARAEQVQSAVLLPIGVGMLAIGSTDPNRFHPGMGTVFLKLIGEAISTAVARFPLT